MDATAAGVRLHLLQAAVRPIARSSSQASPRTLVRRAGLSGQNGSFSGKPRSTTSRGNVSARCPPGRGYRYVPLAGTAILSSRAVRRAQEANIASPLPWPGRAFGPEPADVLPTPAWDTTSP